MPVSSQQLQDDLRGEFRGQLHVDLPHRHLYATDASPFHITPLAVAVPEDADDLRTLVRYAHEHALPLVPRGAGTGLSGESLGSGVVVDLSVHFRRIIHVNEHTVRAECGVVMADLAAELVKAGRRFAPNPWSAATCTVGGMIGTDASGPNVSAHGTTRRHTAGLTVVWDTGETAALTPQRTSPVAGDAPQLRTIEIRTQATALLSKHREAIRQLQPRTPVHKFAARLDAFTPDGLNLVNLLVGSEGTLAIVTAAEWRTVPVPGGVATAVLGFRTLADAVRAGLTVRGFDGVVACDVFDQRLLSLAGPHLPPDGLTVPDGVAAVMVMEFEADSPEVARHFATSAVDDVRDRFAAAALAEPSGDRVPVEAVFAFRRTVVAASYASGPAGRPVPFVDDSAVPAEELVRYVSGLGELLRRAEVPGVFHVQPLTGQVQVRPLLDLNRPTDRAAMYPLADQLHQLVIAVGGTIGSRNGVGVTRTPWVEKEVGPLAGVLAELKRIFDPKAVMNPGKITAPDPSRPAWPMWEGAAVEGRKSRADLRPVTEPSTNPAPTRLPLLAWTADQRDAAVGRCVGCGDCRVRAAPTRMCPTFHATGEEAATPRAKAHLLRLLAGQDRDAALSADEARAIADLCVNCKMCRTECPSRADIPALAAEAKAELHAANGLNRDEWLLARLGKLVRLAAHMPTTSNLLLGSRVARWTLEKLLGLSRRRAVPRLAHRPFLRRAARRGWSDRRPAQPVTDSPLSAVRVAFFADLFVNHSDPLVGEAAVTVLRHQGIEVFVPPRQRECGVLPLAQGDLDAARKLAAHNVRVFADLIREGYVVVCAEPTAAVTIVQDYPRLLDDPDARLMADRTQELTAFLWGLYEAGWLRLDFQKPLPLSVGHHVPCHVKALNPDPAGPKLLRLIPGLHVTTIDESCSGMAGTYGLKASAYEASMRAGKPMLDRLAAPLVGVGSTECGACRIQMQHGAGKRTLHPVQYLALAYGLQPEIERRLRRPPGKLVTD